MMLVVGAQLALAQHMALPRFDLRYHPGKQAQPVIRREDRHAEHVAENAEDEQRLHRGADLERLLGDLVAGHAVQEFAQRPSPPAAARRAIIWSAMTELVGILAVAIVAWFAAGTIWNVRKGRLLMRWMQDGLPALGERTTVRWLGSSVVEMAIRDCRAPFAGVTVVIFLEPRDVPWMWALGHGRGRRDALIFRGVLHRAPGVELEALAPASWSGREALRRVPAEWPVRQEAPGRVVVHHATAAALDRADVLLGLAKRAGLSVERLSVRRNEPHFQLHIRQPDDRQPARGFFEAVRTLAERAVG